MRGIFGAQLNARFLSALSTCHVGSIHTCLSGLAAKILTPQDSVALLQAAPPAVDSAYH